MRSAAAKAILCLFYVLRARLGNAVKGLTMNGFFGVAPKPAKRAKTRCGAKALIGRRFSALSELT
jgi:hypothetical protein